MRTSVRAKCGLVSITVDGFVVGSGDNFIT